MTTSLCDYPAGMKSRGACAGRRRASLVGAPWLTIAGPLAHPRTATSTLTTQFTTLRTQRLANVTLDRATKYYFSNAGNDVTGDGSQGNPYATLDKFATIVAANPSGAQIEFLFNKGDKFLATNSDDYFALYSGMTIGAYGTGAKPILSAFSIQIAGGATWTLDAGTPGVDATYNTSVATSITWFAHVNSTTKLSTPFARCKTLARCRANAQTFYYSSGTLTVNMGSGANPSGTAFEAVKGITNTNNGQFECTGTNIRIEGVRIDGFGIVVDSQITDSAYGLKFIPTLTTSEMVCKDCEIYYTGYHAGAQIGEGKVWFDGVTVGLARLRSDNNATMFVGFSSTGGHEHVLWNCTVASGNLPVDNGTGILGRSAASSYGHIASGSSISLYLVMNLTCTAGTYSALQTAHCDNLPTALASQTYATNEANIRLARGFIFNEVMNYGVNETIQIYPMAVGTGGVVRHACRYAGKIGYTGAVSAGDPGGGWWLNCTFNIGSGTPQANVSMFAPIADSPNFVNCHFELRDGGSIFYKGANASTFPNLSLQNCILSGTTFYVPSPGSYASYTTVNASTIAGNVTNCLVYSVQPCNTATGFTPAGSDGAGSYQTSAPGNNQYRAYAVPNNGSTFNNMPVILAVPTSGDTDLYNVGNATTQCELDFNGATRGSRNTIGPVNGA